MRIDVGKLLLVIFAVVVFVVCEPFVAFEVAAKVVDVVIEVESVAILGAVVAVAVVSDVVVVMPVVVVVIVVVGVGVGVVVAVVVVLVVLVGVVILK